MAWLVPTVRAGQPVDAIVRRLREPVDGAARQGPMDRRNAPGRGARRRRSEPWKVSASDGLAQRVARWARSRDSLEIAHIATTANVSLPGAAGVYVRSPPRSISTGCAGRCPERCRPRTGGKRGRRPASSIGCAPRAGG